MATYSNDLRRAHLSFDKRMTFDHTALEAIIAASGGAVQPTDQVEGLLAKLQALEATGRYGALIKGISKSNDKSNFLALLLEVTFAYQFEIQSIPLDYEVKQDSNNGSSIDFAMKSDDGRVAYFELRLLQQDQATAQAIAEQLVKTGAYAAAMNGDDEQKEVLRVQSTILSKVENKDGKPIKFLKTDAGTLKIIVVCISDIMLGTADLYDCLLATYGDPDVPAEYRRGIFGLFQDVHVEYPKHGQDAAIRFAHLKSTVHAVLFLFRPTGSGALDYSLRQVLVWNRAIMTPQSCCLVAERVNAAIPQLK